MGSMLRQGVDALHALTKVDALPVGQELGLV
jgi:hypothetical protein